MMSDDKSIKTFSPLWHSQRVADVLSSILQQQLLLYFILYNKLIRQEKTTNFFDSACLERDLQIKNESNRVELPTQWVKFCFEFSSVMGKLKLHKKYWWVKKSSLTHVRGQNWRTYVFPSNFCLFHWLFLGHE